MIKGKIILVPFPFDDLSSSKVRPAVCLTDYIGEYNHIVIAFITSSKTDELIESDIFIDSNNSEFKETGLKISSTIRLQRLITISKSIIRRELGQLPDKYRIQIDSCLLKLFKLKTKKT